MKGNLFEKIFSFISGIGVSPGDGEEIKLQKTLLVISAFPFIFSGIAWGCMYIFFGEKLAGIIPLSYAVFSLLSILYYGLTRRFKSFRFSQLLLILILPFALMLALGGFISGSAVILWSLISPLGAMLFDRRSNALYWLLAYAFLVLISGLIQSGLPLHHHFSAREINLFFVINLVAVGGLIFLMFSYFVGKKDFFQARSELLLLNILPKEIAEELKTGGRAKAKQFDAVTIMFTDFKNFTQLSEKLTPEELVAELDTFFNAFDEITGNYNIEKIKTIGDSYMCAGGLPVAHKDHAIHVVSAALEIRQYVKDYAGERKKNGKEPFEMRIGIHTGPVVAGIVGHKKFAYDIWGDAVNIASRMESSGEAGRINISNATYELVKDKFACTPRERVLAKNKGEIEMYFVENHLTGTREKFVSF